MVSPANLPLRKRFRRTDSLVKQGEGMDRVAVLRSRRGRRIGVSTVLAVLVVALCLGAFATVASADDDNARIHFDLGGKSIGVDLTSVVLERVDRSGQEISAPAEGVEQDGRLA